MLKLKTGKMTKDPNGHKLTGSGDTSLRFNRSVVLHKGKAILIDGVESTFGVTAGSLDEDGEFSNWERYDIRKCKVSGLHVGWFMSGGAPYYLSRLPSRRYSQGLTINNCRCYTVDGEGVLTSSDSIAIALEQKGIPFEEISKCKKKNGYFILSKDVMVEKQEKTYNLYLFSDHVGSVNPVTREVTLKNSGLFSVYHAKFTEAGLA